jgi:hypothetical protein
MGRSCSSLRRQGGKAATLQQHRVFQGSLPLACLQKRLHFGEQMHAYSKVNAQPKELRGWYEPVSRSECFETRQEEVTNLVLDQDRQSTITCEAGIFLNISKWKKRWRNGFLEHLVGWQEINGLREVSQPALPCCSSMMCIFPKNCS